MRCRATLACSALTAYSAIGKLPAPGRNEWVAVLGCGGLGLIAISVLKARGAAAIVGCDIDDTKLAAAQKLGAKKTVNTRAPDALQQMQGVAAAIDFVGSPATAATSRTPGSRSAIAVTGWSELMVT